MTLSPAVPTDDMPVTEEDRAAARRSGQTSPVFDPPVALGECRHARGDDDERDDDLQRPSAALLGAIWRQCGPCLARDRVDRDHRLCRAPGRWDRDDRRARALARPDGQLQRRAFPGWITIPSRYNLADARLWHLAFAWLLAVSLLALHDRQSVEPPLQARPDDQRATRSGRAHLWHDIKDHARLRFPTGAAALRYNILQKLAYASVLFVLLPLMILTGLTHVAGDGFAAGRGCSTFSADGSRRGRSTSSRWRADRLLHRPHRDGRAGRAVQRNSVDDHRPVSTARASRERARGDRTIDPPRADRRVGAGGLLLGGCDRLNAARVPRILQTAERSTAAASVWSPAAASRANIARDRDVAGLPHQRHALPGSRRISGPCGEQFRELAAASSMGSSRARCRCRSSDLGAVSAAHADHAPRLRRGLERDRQMARAAARRDPATPRDCRDRARYIVFHCADDFGGAPYYESDRPVRRLPPADDPGLRMNGQPLPVGHGAPLRLRVERQLGYKHAKFVMRIEARERSTDLFGGKGGYWEDAAGYHGMRAYDLPLRRRSLPRRCIYAIAGFGGGSTYTALLVLAGTDYRAVPILSLACNIIVVSAGTWRFAKAGHFDWRRAWPLFVTSIPAAWIGGRLMIERDLFIAMLAGSLLVAGLVMLWEPTWKREITPDTGSRWFEPVAGGSLGLLAGIVGIGGGIFLAPLLYLLRWDAPRRIAATCAVFILVNSIAGLAGQATREWRRPVPCLASTPCCFPRCWSGDSSGRDWGAQDRSEVGAGGDGATDPLCGSAVGDGGAGMTSGEMMSVVNSR